MLIAILQCLSDFSVAHPWWTSVLTVLITAYISRWIKSAHLRTPPGPMGVPFLGYLPFLGKDQHLELTNLQQVYGSIFSLTLGARRAVILSDVNSIKEAFSKEELSSRPPEVVQMSRDSNSLGNASLKQWKESRDFTSSVLDALGGKGKKFEEDVKEQARNVVDRFLQLTGRTQVGIRNVLLPAITSINVSLICGRKPEKDADLGEATELYFKRLYTYARFSGLVLFLPVLRFLLPALYPDVRKIKEMSMLERIFWKEIYSHEDSFNESSLDDYMGYFIAEMRRKESDKKTSFTKSNLNGNCQLLLSASTDTVLCSVEWAILLMAAHPEVQEKAQQEIDQAVGRDRLPSGDDRHQLHYLNAVLTECARIKTVMPLGMPHWATSNAKVGIYDLPKDTLVIANLHAAHTDPEIWDKPHEFRPERFLTQDGKPRNDTEHLVFSTGNRRCVGENLAKMEVFLFVAALLQKCKIVPPVIGLSLESEFNNLQYPRCPFVRVLSRDFSKDKLKIQCDSS